MGEDVSQQVRLSVTVVLSAMVISTTASLLMIGSVLLNDWTDNYVVTVNMQNVSAFNALNNSTTPIGAPMVYRILEEKRSVIAEIKITWKDGTVITGGTEATIDNAIDDLLANGDKSVVVRCEERSSGFYITIVEAD